MKPDPSPQSKFSDIFSLYHDQAHPDAIDNDIRSGVRVSGTNLWVLMFAILIACIGLNVNSTAVIIGAMLISPLMGPIVGVGYGVAVGDLKLIRLALRNMLIFIIISLLSATLYFFITPLEQAQSELLARTQPNLWDVLIAFFGGSAGIIAITRKEVSNVIPGVAIATALMPPLCTAGYGLAQGQWEYFFGAFYLFLINCVFIAFSTLIFVNLLRLPRRGLITETTRKRQQMIIASLVIAITVPSVYLGMKLVQKELFNTKVMNSIKEVQQGEGFFILNSNIDSKQKSVSLIINGAGNATDISEKIRTQLIDSGIAEPQVRVLYAGGSLENLNDVKQELLANQQNSQALQNKLEQQSVYIQSLIAQNTNNTQDEQLLKELQAQYPTAKKIIIAQGAAWDNTPNNDNTSNDNASGATDDANNQEKTTPNTYVVYLVMSDLSAQEYERLYAWLKVRLEDKPLNLVVETLGDE